MQMTVMLVVCSLVAVGICVIAYGIIHDWCNAKRREKEQLEREELKASRTW